MATTKDDLRHWFDRGVKCGATHMIVVCDTFEHEDYPVYVDPDADLHDVVKRHDEQSMQRVMEVYDLKADREAQMSTPRVRADHAA